MVIQSIYVSVFKVKLSHCNDDNLNDLVSISLPSPVTPMLWVPGWNTPIFISKIVHKLSKANLAKQPCYTRDIYLGKLVH